MSYEDYENRRKKQHNAWLKEKEEIQKKLRSINIDENSDIPPFIQIAVQLDFPLHKVAHVESHTNGCIIHGGEKRTIDGVEYNELCGKAALCKALLRQCTMYDSIISDENAYFDHWFAEGWWGEIYDPEDWENLMSNCKSDWDVFKQFRSVQESVDWHLAPKSKYPSVSGLGRTLNNAFIEEMIEHFTNVRL